MPKNLVEIPQVRNLQTILDSKADIYTIGEFLNGNLLLPTDKGILLNKDAPVYPYQKIRGNLRARTSGGSLVVSALFLGVYTGFFYTVGSNGYAEVVLPYDYVLNSDLYLSLYWSHNGTSISGTFSVSVYFSFAKGFSKEIFPTETLSNYSISTPDIATIPRYTLRTEDLQISSLTPNTNQINSNILQPGGVLLVALTVNTIPTIGGGTSNRPVIFDLVLSYRSKTTGLVNKDL
jgi:hypothetical protein